MTAEQKREALKTVLVILFGVLSLLSVFGPLSAYREWFLLAAGCVSIIAGAVFGVTLTPPAQQARNIKASKIEIERLNQFMGGNKGQG